MRKLLIVLLPFLFFVVEGCTQAEVVADKVIKELNEKIGKHQVQLKDAEKLLVKLKEAKRKALINEKMSKKGISGHQDQVKEAQGKLAELKGQIDKITAIEAKGSPYVTSKGKEITRAKLNNLKTKVNLRLKVAQQKLKAAEQALRISTKSASGNQLLSERLELKIVDLQGKVEIIKNNIGLLEDMEEQRKLNNSYDTSIAQGLLKDMDKTISELDVTIDIDLETMFDDTKTNSSGLSDDDVNLIDEL